VSDAATANVVIIDSGGANIASLEFAFARLGATTRVTSDASVIRAAPRVVLPGVGAAKDAMTRLRASGLDRLIPELTQPVLGICLGMQLLCRDSEEGPSECLGVVPTRVTRLSPAPGLPVPNMGWCRTVSTSGDDLLAGLPADEYFYYVHGFAVAPNPATTALAQHGTPITAALRHRNFSGTQFHPERSGRAGARVLENFLRLAA
jgi:glutamine amidotransferase